MKEKFCFLVGFSVWARKNARKLCESWMANRTILWHIHVSVSFVIFAVGCFLCSFEFNAPEIHILLTCVWASCVSCNVVYAFRSAHIFAIFDWFHCSIACWTSMFNYKAVVHFDELKSFDDTYVWGEIWCISNTSYGHWKICLKSQTNCTVCYK